MEKKLKRKELTVKYDKPLDALSLVKFPAIEIDFLKFGKESNITLSKIDLEKRIITGPALIPNKDIYRYDDLTNEEYFIYFSEETVRKIAELYIKDPKVNLEHTEFVDGIEIIESWFVEDPENDKANKLGYSVNPSTWMTSFKVNNDDVWNDIKSGEYRGFSIEGFFVKQFVKQSSDIDSELIDLISDIDDVEILQNIADYIDKCELKKWRSTKDSSNVDKMLYDDEKQELVIKFNDGEIYTYSNLDMKTAYDVISGNANPLTTGSNEYGSWDPDKYPSLGAAVYKYLVSINYPFKKGGSLR